MKAADNDGRFDSLAVPAAAGAPTDQDEPIFTFNVIHWCFTEINMRRVSDF